MITRIKYCAANSNMGDTSDQDSDNFRAWAYNELEKQYPDACIAIYNNEGSSACFSNLDDFYKMDLEENECLEFMAELWNRCPWSGEFFD